MGVSTFLALPRRLVRQGLSVPRSHAIPPAPYGISCPCGKEITGDRAGKPQTVVCPTCRLKYFVFPTSPWQILGAVPSEPNARAMVASSRTRSWWTRPVLAGCLTFVLIISAFMLAWDLLGRADLGRHKNASYDSGIAVMIDQLERGHAIDGIRSRLMRDKAALAADRILVPSEHARLARNHEQIGALLDLSAAPLESILADAKKTPPVDWRERFQQRYGGKTIILALGAPQVQSDGMVLPYVIAAGNTRAELILETGGQSLERVPAADAAGRWLFAARVQSCRMEALSGNAHPRWVVRLDGQNLVPLEEERLRRLVLRPVGDEPDGAHAVIEPSDSVLKALTPHATMFDVTRHIGAAPERLLQASAGERRVQWRYAGPNPVYLTFGGQADQPLRLLNWGRLHETTSLE